MKKFLIFWLLMLPVMVVMAQTNPVPTPEKPYIEVTGSAEKEIVPNEIFISITLKERIEGKDKITIEKQEADLKTAIQSIGINLENLSLSDANANYVKVKWTKKDVVAKSEYLLKVGDATTVGKVFEKLDDLKINEAYISKVSHTKLEEYKKEVRILAIKAAKDKADYLLEAIGEKTGKALVVTENLSFANQGFEKNYKTLSGVNFYAPDQYNNEIYSEVIEFQKIKIESSIYVKFEIQ